MATSTASYLAVRVTLGLLLIVLGVVMASIGFTSEYSFLSTIVPLLVLVPLGLFNIVFALRARKSTGKVYNGGLIRSFIYLSLMIAILIVVVMYSKG